MGRNAAVAWHASTVVLAAILYFLFTLPRWWELTGFTPHVLGTVLRIVTGLLIAAAALPALSTLQRARRPEFGTPQLALTLLRGSIVAQAVAGALIAVTAVSEIWLSLDAAGPCLFGIYGAAAAIALLGVGAFYLSFVAELPPAPPKPLKPKKEKAAKATRRSRRKGDAAEETAGEQAAGEETEDETVDEAAAEDAETVDEAAAEDAGDDATEAESAETTEPELRPSGKRAKSRD